MGLISNVDQIECVKITKTHAHYVCIDSSYKDFKGIAKIPLDKNENFINAIESKGLPFSKWYELINRQ